MWLFAAYGGNSQAETQILEIRCSQKGMKLKGCGLKTSSNGHVLLYP